MTCLSPIVYFIPCVFMPSFVLFVFFFLSFFLSRSLFRPFVRLASISRKLEENFVSGGTAIARRGGDDCRSWMLEEDFN